MRYIFNTANINAVGVKIYYGETLRCESLISGGIFPLVLEIEGSAPQTITIEVCHESELCCVKTPERFGMYRNSEIFGNEKTGCRLDEGATTSIWQFAYRTIISNLKEDKVLLDFVDVNGFSQCGVIVLQSEEGGAGNCMNQWLERRYNRSRLKKGLFVQMLKSLLLTFLIYGGSLLLLSPFFDLDVSAGTMKMIAGGFGVILLVPLIYPFFRMKMALDEYRNLLTAEKVAAEFIEDHSKKAWKWGG